MNSWLPLAVLFEASTQKKWFEKIWHKSNLNLNRTMTWRLQRKVPGKPDRGCYMMPVFKQKRCHIGYGKRSGPPLQRVPVSGVMIWSDMPPDDISRLWESRNFWENEMPFAFQWDTAFAEVGSVMNFALPSWLILILLIVILVHSAFKTFKKAKKESFVLEQIGGGVI